MASPRGQALPANAEVRNGCLSLLPPCPGLSEWLDVLSLLLAWTLWAGGQARWASPSSGLYSDFPVGSDAPGKAESQLWGTWARHIFCSSGDIFGAAGIWDANTDYRTRLLPRGEAMELFPVLGDELAARFPRSSLHLALVVLCPSA